VVHRKERGRGTAGIEGLKHCLKLGAEYVIEMDADFSHDPAYIPLFLRQMDRYDVVIGSRFVRGGGDSDRSLSRIIISKVSRIIYLIGLRTRLKDVASGYKCYRSSALKGVGLDRFISRGFGVSVEINHKLERKGYKILEYPIKFAKRKEGSSKLRFKDFIESLSLIVKMNLGY
jgi:dolichol-phosphate mannosyltransferase